MDYKIEREERNKAIRKFKGHLGKAASKAGWEKLGSVAQNTRWLPPTRAKVSEPHVYAEEDDLKRLMRWIASYLSARYNIGSEVQCYYDISTRRIVVAANDNSDIEKLKSMVGNMSLAAVFNDVSIQQIPIGLYATTPKASQGQRHWEELKKLANIAKKSMGERGLSKVSFYVVPCIRGVRSLHAEQRILCCLRGEAENGSLMLRPELLGGIKRPCFACAHACFTSDDRKNVHSGLFWDTMSATDMLEQSANEDIAEAMQGQPEVYRTLISRTRKETEDVGSESEDEDNFYSRVLGKL